MGWVTVTRASDLAREGARPRALEPENPPVSTGGEATREEALDRLARWTWRHRRELAPAALLVALASMLETFHEGRADLAWLALLLVPAAGLVVLLALRGEGDRAFVVRCIAPAALWSVCCWWVGFNDPVVAGSGLLGAALLMAAWWRRTAPRARVEVAGASWMPFTEGWRYAREARRELGHVDAIWAWIAKKSGVEGARLARLVADIDEGYALHLELPRGQLGKDIKADRLASALREFRVGAILTPDPHRPWEVVLVEAPEPEEPVIRIMEDAG